ncbi:MAG: AAA family ATPase [Roseiflexaceae bacterium]
MIIIINGPLGIGKTSTSWELVWRFERAVMLDADHVAAFHPFDHYNDAHLAYVHATLRVLVAHHYGHGFQDFVINWVFETPVQLARLKQELAEFGLPIHVYRLVCAEPEVERRVRKRNRTDPDKELRRARELIGILDAAARPGDLGQVIDTSDLSAEQTAVAILRDIA